MTERRAREVDRERVRMTHPWTGLGSIVSNREENVFSLRRSKKEYRTERRREVQEGESKRILPKTKQKKNTHTHTKRCLWMHLLKHILVWTQVVCVCVRRVYIVSSDVTLSTLMAPSVQKAETRPQVWHSGNKQPSSSLSSSDALPLFLRVVITCVFT